MKSIGSRRRKMSIFKKLLPLYLMLLPGIIYLIINNYIPMAGVVVAFKKYNANDGLFFSPWTGISNFTYLFSTKDSWIIIRNTFLYNVAFLIINNVVGIALAIMIFDVANKRLKKMYQSAVLLPFLISIVVVSYIVYALLSHKNGMMNMGVLKILGKDPVQWYNDTTWWPFILITVNCWKIVGYGTLIYIAGISGIAPSYYEAADLDGANKLQQIIHITLPCLAPSIVTLILIGIGRIFYSDFGLFYQVPQNSGSLFSVTNTIDTYVYRALTSSGGVGRSAAAGLFQSAVGFLMVMLSNMVVSKVSPENAIF